MTLVFQPGIQQSQHQVAQTPGSMESKRRDFECMQQALTTHGPVLHVSMEPNPSYQISAAACSNNDTGLYEVEHLTEYYDYESIHPSAAPDIQQNRSTDYPPPYIEILR